MALAIAATATWNTGNVAATSYSVTLPSGIASGNLLLMVFSYNGTSSVLTYTGWTQLAVDTTNSETIMILARIADGTEGSTVSFTGTVSVNAAANTYRITGNRNGLTSSEVVVSSAVAVTSNVTTGDPPNLTPSWGSAENLWLAICGTNDGAITSIVSYPTNYSLDQLTNINGAGTGEAIMTAARLLTATSEDPGVFTWTTARRPTSYTVAVRPAPDASLLFNPQPFQSILVR